MGVDYNGIYRKKYCKSSIQQNRIFLLLFFDKNFSFRLNGKSSFAKNNEKDKFYVNSMLYYQSNFLASRTLLELTAEETLKIFIF